MGNNLKQKKIIIFFGTRPEAIKLVPVIKLLKKDKNITTFLCSTGQHKEMLEQVLNIFKLKPDCNLALMTDNQDLSDLTSILLKKIKEILGAYIPDLLIVQGDTTSAFIASLAAFYKKIKVAHVEAGLRSHNNYSPFPEEMNRKIISLIADFHFAPSKYAQENLIREGIDPGKIYITGNTVIDALIQIKQKLSSSSFSRKIENKLSYSINPEILLENEFVLITMHRREKFGEKLKKILETIKKISIENQNYSFIYPVHLNPNVVKPVTKVLSGLKNVYLLHPLDYLTFSYLMKKCRLIMTDSGGIQEEAYVFSKPVMVLRDVTERMEAVHQGYAFIAGTKSSDIKKVFSEIDFKISEGFNFFQNENPYGDGHAAEKIVYQIKKSLG